MVTLIFLSVIVLHALVHLTVFLRHRHVVAYQPRPGKTALSYPPGSRVTGLPWLLSAVLFLIATAAFLLLRTWFWLPATAALVVSQTLIFLYWDEARLGTAINAVVFVAALLNAAAFRFDHQVNREVMVLRQQAAKRNILITEEKVASLPSPVRRWMRRANVVGKRTPNTLRVTQRGELRLSPEGDWLPFEAVQHVSIDPPAFVWSARVRMAPGLYIAGRDKLLDGKGNMLIRPLYLVTAANSSGDEVDQGTFIRFLAEMAWFPQAAASDLLTWKSINDSTASVHLRSGTGQVEGTYFFNRTGQVTGFEAMRYGDFDGQYRKELWSVSVNGYKSFGGIETANSTIVAWKLEKSDFEWFKVEVTDIEQGAPSQQRRD